MRQTLLQEVGMPICTQMAFIFLMAPPLDKSQGPSQLHGHNPWLVCEVALIWSFKC